MLQVWPSATVTDTVTSGLFLHVNRRYFTPSCSQRNRLQRVCNQLLVCLNCFSPSQNGRDACTAPCRHTTCHQVSALGMTCGHLESLGCRCGGCRVEPDSCLRRMARARRGVCTRRIACALCWEEACDKSGLAFWPAACVAGASSSGTGYSLPRTLWRSPCTGARSAPPHAGWARSWACARPSTSH